MQAADMPRAVAAARSSAAVLGLRVDDAVVLHASNRLAVRLLPCDVLARVATVAHRAGAAFEVEVARRLAATGSPVAALAPRVAPHASIRDGFVITLWTYYEPAPPHDLAPAEFAHALARLHAGLRRIDLPAPHCTDRVAEGQRLVDDRTRTPDLPGADRQLLGDTLRRMRRAVVDRGATEQLLHGEPHPGNVLRTRHGLRFIDLETCCRGPVEFDLAHAPEDVGAHYPGVDRDLLRDCRVLMLAMIIAWRWDRDDQLPHGRQRGVEWLGQLRAALDRDGRAR
jgi:hypothetical protein